MRGNKTIAAALVGQEIAEMIREEERAAAMLQTLKELHAKKIEKIRRLILHGKATTGDRISDFFIGAYGIINDAEVSKPFRELAGQVAGKNGEFFIAIRRKKEEWGPVFKGGLHSIARPFNSRFHIKTRYFLGIFSADELVLDMKAASYNLPTEEYVELLIDPPTKLPGPFRFHGHELLQLPSIPAALLEEIHTDDGSVRALEVIAGCDAVFKYSPPELHAKPGTRSAHWIIALNSAIRLLGRDIPEAPEEIAEREGKLYTP